MIQEFVCPNGRMSVNGVCPIFEGDDGQIKDTFKFDFEQPTESSNETATNIIKKNLNTYNSFVEEKLGIKPAFNNLITLGMAFATGSPLPFVAKMATGAFINNQNQQIYNQDTQGTINTVTSPKILNMKPSNRDLAMGKQNLNNNLTQQQAGPGFSNVTEAGSF